jgi:Fis family transcriptional regulator
MSDITTLTLSRFVEQKLSHYFEQLEGQSPEALYELVIKEAEKGLLRIVMEKANGNQSLAAKMLGLARGTLRKKLEEACLD